MIKNKKFFENKVARLERMLNDKVKDRIELKLSCYKPDGNSRYQIEVTDKKLKKIICFLPRGSHYRINDFDKYIEGFLDAIEELPFFNVK